MTGELVFFDGQLVPRDEARVPIDDRTVLYGDGVFETIRAYRGVPFRLHRHLKRLETGCRTLRLDCPVQTGDIVAAVDELLRVNRLEAVDAVVRITVTGGRSCGPTGLERAGPSSLLITATDYHRRSQRSGGGVSLDISPIRRDPSSPLTGIKSTSFMSSLLAKQAARDAGADDAVMLTPTGHVSEATAANIFWVAAGVLFTPDVGCGLLPGITREAVIEIATGKGVECRFVTSGIEELLGADEVFLTNSLVEVAPVSAIAGRTFAVPGPVTTLLGKRYGDLVRTASH
ncbi:MAG: hypothetical protein GXP34_01255 [Actinobacteria bacterium]|nr:hypothetical protein [Actinomycetota bacterium]